MCNFLRKIFEPVDPRSNREYKLITVCAVFSILLTVIDQWTKIIIERTFVINSGKVIIEDFFSLVYVTNPGAAWGILAGKWYILLGIALAAVIFCILCFRKLTENYPERYVCIALLLSGIVGNSIDRIWRGEVVDFLDFYISWNGKFYHWPAFNVADIAICCGVGIYIISILFRKEKKDEDADK